MLTIPPLAGSNGRIAGVVLHALQVDQLLRFALAGDSPIHGLLDFAEAGWLWLWCLAGVGLALSRVRFRRLLTLMAGALILLAGVWRIAFLHQIWLPLAAPVLGLTVAAALSAAYLSVHDHVERRLLMSLFARQAAPEVADTLWRERARLVAGGRLLPQHLTATVLFADIRGFASIAENLEPAQLMDWLNVYMAAMTQAVMAHGGMVRQYVGDEVMALFGVPAPRRTEAEVAGDAARAVECALAMGERLRCLNADWAQHGLPVAAVRIGIYTGPLVAGSLGDSQRFEYAVVGDTVNIASRLENFDKDAHHPVDGFCRVLVGDATLRYLGGRFQVTGLGQVRFKGKKQEIAVYRVDGDLSE